MHPRFFIPLWLVGWFLIGLSDRLVPQACAESVSAAPSPSDLMQDLNSVDVTKTQDTTAPSGPVGPINSLAFKYSPAWIEKPNAPSVSKAPELRPMMQAAPGDQFGGGGGGDAGDGKQKTPRTGLRLMPYGLHYCFFVAPDRPEAQVDQMIREIVTKYADCNVAVQPHVFTMTDGYSHNPKQLQNQAVTACNVEQRYGERGAVQVDVGDGNIAGQMCNDPGAAGCSTLCERTSFSVVGPTAKAGTALHESGHSNCCGVLCVNKGQGIRPAGDGGLGLDLVASRDLIDFEKKREKYYAAEGDAKEGNFNKAACDSIRAGASTKAEGFQDQRGQRLFYSKADAGKQIDLNLMKGVLEYPPKKNGNQEEANGEGGEEGDDSDPVDLAGALGDEELQAVIDQGTHPNNGAGEGLNLKGGAAAGNRGSGGGAGGADPGPMRLEYDEGAPKVKVGGTKGGAAGFTAVSSAYEGGPAAGADSDEPMAPPTGFSMKSGKAIEMDEGAPKGAPGAGYGMPGPSVAKGASDGRGAMASKKYGVKRGLSSLTIQRQRGASLKRYHPLKVQAGDLESTRPPADFAVDPNKDPAQ